MKFFTGFESFVGVDFWTCLFTLCNLVILYLVMVVLLFKPVKNMIDSRQKEVDDLYDNANRAKAEAEEMRARYETRLQQANAESEALLLCDANRRAQLREEEILRDAQDKAAQTMQRAERAGRAGKEARHERDQGRCVRHGGGHCLRRPAARYPQRGAHRTDRFLH